MHALTRLGWLSIVVATAACTGAGTTDPALEPDPSPSADATPAPCDPLAAGCGLDDGASYAPCCDWETQCRKTEVCDGQAVYCRALDVGGGEGTSPPDCEQDDPGGDGDIGDGDGDIGDGDGDIGDGDGDGDGDIGDGDGDGDGDDAGGLVPAAPSDIAPQWQGQQALFLVDNQPCLGHLAAAMGDQLVCYGHVDGEMRCAGRLGETLFGSTFTPVGLLAPVQILIRPTWGGPSANGLCYVDVEGVGWCLGGNNTYGVYGVGHTEPLVSPTPFDVDAPLEAFGTGTFDALCAKTIEGEVFCAGYDFGVTPVAMGPADWFWQDAAGNLHPDSYVVVHRASDGRTEATVRASGLDSPVGTFGTPGAVVHGGLVAEDPDGMIPEPSACWLETDKTVRCWSMPQPTYFEPGRVIALVLNPYARALCAVYDDASLWCVGDNPAGMLGATGAELAEETLVQPPGSVAVGCGGLP
jgi:hypothetical protein